MATLKFEAITKLPAGKDGKTRWHKCGAVFESDKGLSLKLESLPIGFDGWLSLREPRPKDGAKPVAPTAPPTDGFENESIPF